MPPPPKKRPHKSFTLQRAFELAGARIKVKLDSTKKIKQREQKRGKQRKKEEKERKKDPAMQVQVQVVDAWIAWRRVADDANEQAKKCREASSHSAKMVEDAQRKWELLIFTRDYEQTFRAHSEASFLAVHANKILVSEDFRAQVMTESDQIARAVAMRATTSRIADANSCYGNISPTDIPPNIFSDIKLAQFIKDSEERAHGAHAAQASTDNHAYDDMGKSEEKVRVGVGKTTKKRSTSKRSTS